MKKLLAFVVACMCVFLLVSCSEELPASDYVKKGKIMVDNTIPFVIDDSVAIDAKEAECALLVGAHYSSFAAKFGYKVFHYAAIPGISSLCKYYTVYPLNDGRLLYVIVDKNDKGDYVVARIIDGENKNLIGGNLKKLRIKLKISQQDLSNKLELLGVYICRGSVSRIEDYSRTVTDIELFAIAEVLDVDPKELYHG